MKLCIWCHKRRPVEDKKICKECIDAYEKEHGIKQSNEYMEDKK